MVTDDFHNLDKPSADVERTVNAQEGAKSAWAAEIYRNVLSEGRAYKDEMNENDKTATRN